MVPRSTQTSGENIVEERLRILVVDDSEGQRRAVRRELDAMQVELIEASNGWQALRLAAEVRPHLITLDIELPEFDGYRVLEQLRSQQATRGLPVIMISGSPNAEERFRAQEDGAIAYFSKPFEPGSLRALVSETVDRVNRNRATRVWCVTERQELVERVSRTLSPHGYRFKAFSDTERLADDFEKIQSGVLLLDLNLKNQGAYRIMSQLSLLEEEQRPRVLGVMSGASDADLAHAFRRGLNDFVCEPFSVEELNARIDHLVTAYHERRQLRDMALLDKLTSLPNRRQLERDAAAASSKTIRQRQRLGLVILDVDHFKRINDTHGHAFGDQVLAAVGKALHGCLRAHDIIGRYGGEEFAMLVPDASSSGMTIVAERLRRHVEAMQLSCAGEAVPVTVSVGTCMWDYSALLSSPDLSELVKPADEALYRAKRTGRNRHCAGVLVER